MDKIYQINAHGIKNAVKRKSEAWLSGGVAEELPSYNKTKRVGVPTETFGNDIVTIKRRGSMGCACYSAGDDGVIQVHGFTLIELLVVVLIIGLLAAVAVPQYQKTVSKARAMSLVPLLRAINDAQNRYFMSNGNYTLSFDDLDIEMPEGGTLSDIEDQQFLVYKGFYCNLRKSANSSSRNSYSAYCNSKKADKVLLEKYFHQSNFLCWGAPATRAYSVCQSISGKATPDWFNNSNTSAAFRF